MEKVQWTLRSSDYDFLDSPPMPMPKAIWQLLQSRQLTDKETINDFLSCSLRGLKDPFAIDQMDVAVDRLLKARELQEKICIYADFDLDGTPGLALMKQGLEKLGFADLVYFQPRRLVEGYGFHWEVAERFINEGVKLFLTIDVGITAIETVEKINKAGSDVIISDHHLPKEQLPQALAIVNPNKGTCSSGLGHLCGAGVAFYIILALRKKLREQGESVSFDPKELLDCFAIATITDLVPMVEENRVLVRHGLEVLRRTKRPGLRSLLKELKLLDKPELTATDVAMRFSPKLNALTRMDKELLPLDIFLVEDPEEAKSYIGKVLSTNSDRLKMQELAEQEANKIVTDEEDSEHFIFVFSKDFHKGVVGLVATRLAEKYQVPAFVGSLLENGQIHGSGRVPKGSSINLTELLEAGTQHLEQFGGHAAAAGFCLLEEEAEGLKSALKNYFVNHPAKEKTQTVFYDFSGSIDELNSSFMKWYDELAPFGVDFETPILKVEGAILRSFQLLKNKHYKVKLQSSSGNGLIDGIWFSPGEDHHCLPGKNIDVGDELELLVEPQWNYFLGNKTLQLLIKDIRSAVANHG